MGENAKKNPRAKRADRELSPMRGNGGFCLLVLVPGYHMMQKPIKLPDVIITPLGELRWRSGESTRLRQMWPSFKSRRLRWRLRQMWVEFVIASLHYPERFFSRNSGFPFSSKTSTSRFQFDLEHTNTLKRVVKNFLSVSWVNKLQNKSQKLQLSVK